MSVKLFKDGKKHAIQTNCRDAVSFMEEFSVMLSKLIEAQEYQGEWEQQLRQWLPGLVDICNAMSGYKNTVEKEVVYTSGGKILGLPPIHEFDFEEETAPATANGFRAEAENATGQ